MTEKEFISSLKGEQSQKINIDQWIIIENEVIDDDVFLDGVTVPIKLRIDNCEFKGYFDTDGCTFNDLVEISSCKFNGFFLGGTFNRKLTLNDLEEFRLRGGRYDEIEVQITGNGKVWINRGEFSMLKIQGGQNLIEEFVIINFGRLIGNIKVDGIKSKKVSLIGSNLNYRYDYEQISTDYFKIRGFENSGLLIISKVKDLSNGKSYFEVVNSNLKEAHFGSIQFNSFSKVIFIDSQISKISVQNSFWDKTCFYSLEGPAFTNNIKDENKRSFIEINQLKETFRQLKTVYNNQNDKEISHFFYAKEMDQFYKTINWTLPCYEEFWQKLILYLSRKFTNYGSSFLKPLVLLFSVNCLIFIVLILFFNYESLISDFSNDSKSASILATGEYFKLINPVHKLNTSLKGWGIFWDLLSRVSSSYFIYAMIRSTRRYIRI